MSGPTRGGPEPHWRWPAWPRTQCGAAVSPGGGEWERRGRLWISASPFPETPWCDSSPPGPEATVHLVRNAWLPAQAPWPHPPTALFALSGKADGP